MRKAVVALFVLVLVGWAGGWSYASRLADRQLDAWLQAEATQGRVWTCPQRTVGGFPFALTFTCDDATFAGRGPGRAVEASVAHLEAEVSLAHPTTVAIKLRPPFSYKTSDGTADLTGRWANLRIDLEGLPEVGRVALHGEDIAIRGVFGSVGEQGGQAKTLDAAFAPTTAGDGSTIAFDAAVTQTDMPPMDAFLGGKMPVDFVASGRVNNASVSGAATPEALLEQWRIAGGTVDVDTLRIVRGEARLNAKGRLGLDDTHRLQGRLYSQFVGLEPILKRFGINVNLASAGSFLSSLLGGRKEEAKAEPGALALPINLQNGRVALGPVVTQIELLPLY